MPNGPLAACLFDLDGTLLDSVELIFQSYEHAYRACGRRVPTRGALLAGLGRPLHDQFRQDGHAPDEIEALVAAYRAYNLEHHDALVRGYPDVLDGLRALRSDGVRLAVVTSKKRDTAQRGIACIGAEGLFEAVVALEDTRRHKPDPEPVLAALARLDVAPAHAAYVGDSPHDMAAGHAAGVRTWSVAWGPFPEAAFADVHVDAYVTDPREWLALARARAPSFGA